MHSSLHLVDGFAIGTCHYEGPTDELHRSSLRPATYATTFIAAWRRRHARLEFTATAPGQFATALRPQVGDVVHLSRAIWRLLADRQFRFEARCARRDSRAI